MSGKGRYGFGKFLVDLFILTPLTLGFWPFYVAYRFLKVGHR